MTCQLRIMMIKNSNSHNTIPLVPHPRITPYATTILCFASEQSEAIGKVVFVGRVEVGISLLFSFQIAFLAAPGARI